jgi:hypothetical protein
MEVVMSLTKTRRKALKKLQGTANELWLEQQYVLDRSAELVREAAHQAAALNQEEVMPRVRVAADNLGASIGRNVEGARIAAREVRSRFATDVLPAVGSAIGSAAAVLQVANNPQLQSLIARTQPQPVKRSTSAGAYVALGLGIVAAVGVGYALWQTLRADDELWIADDESERGED